MRFVDTHTHAWGRDTAELPWQHSELPPEWSGPYTHSDLTDDMDECGVNEAVVVTTPLYGRGPRANEYTMRSIEAHPDRLWGVSLIDFFRDSKQVRADFRRATGHKRILGVRMHAALAYGDPPGPVERTGDWILSDSLEPVWDESARSDKAIFIFPKAEQLSMIATLAERYPDVQFVVDHMAWPDEVTAPDEGPWITFKQVAEHTNVAVKVSSLPRSANDPWPYKSLHGYVRRLMEWFGPERLMLGSDYPWMDDWATYKECLSWVEACEYCSARDYAYLSHRTFDRIHRS